MIVKRDLRKQVRRDFAYTPALETDLRKKFKQIAARQQEAATTKPPRGWSNTDMTQEELDEAYKLMGMDYEAGDPYKEKLS